MNMERRGDDRPDAVTLGSSWLGLDGGQLVEMIRRQLMDLGATITSESGDRTVFRLDATAGSLLRRTGLTIRNARRVSTNERMLDRNRGVIASNRRWIDAARTAMSVRRAAPV